MNFIKSAFAGAITIVALFASGCSNKNAAVLTEQCQLLNEQLTTLVSENPDLIAEAKAEYTTDKFAVDVKITDSLIVISQISDPLFEYFTACEVKEHLTKNLEATVNALTAEKLPITVTVSDVYGESHTYSITPADLRRMIKAPLSQFRHAEAREGLFEALATAGEQFRPEKGNVKSITTSFKGGFFSYNLEFANSSSYKDLTTANLKFRALKVLQHRYANLGTLRPVLFKMYKSLGVEGFHLVYTDGNKSTLKTTVLLSNI